MQKKEEKRPKQNLKFILVITALVLLSFYLFSSSSGSSQWSLSGKGLIEYPQNRGKPVYTLTQVEEGENYLLKKAVFESKGAKIYSLIYLPKSDN